MKNYYVVSADVRWLLLDWARRRGFIMPSLYFFKVWRHDFIRFMIKIYPDFQLIPEEYLASGLSKLASLAHYPVVSIDRTYFKCPFYLEFSRLVNIAGEDCGIGSRFGCASLKEQAKVIRRQAGSSIVLLDDVIFSGESLFNIVTDLADNDIKVRGIIGGIVTSEGQARLNQTCPVKSVLFYKDLVDEVCERDFFPGIPLSGRSVNINGNFGIPYIKPFGYPNRWASIPQEQERTISRFCLRQAIKLFLEIERRSSKNVLCCDIERKTIGLMATEERYVDYLSNILLAV